MRFDPVGTGESHSCLQRWPRLRWSTSRSTHLNRSRCTFTGHLSLPADIGFPSSGGASGGPPLFVLFCYVMFLFVVFFSFPSFVVLLYIYIFFFILSNFLSLPPLAYSLLFVVTRLISFAAVAGVSSFLDGIGWEFLTERLVIPKFISIHFIGYDLDCCLNIIQGNRKAVERRREFRCSEKKTVWLSSS